MAVETLFLDLCNTFESIANTTKRLEIQAILAAFVKRVALEDPASLAPVLFLCTASAAPPHRGVELGVGDTLLHAVVSAATGLSPGTIRTRYAATGDLGCIAMEHRVSQLFVCPRRLTVSGVHSGMLSVAAASGKSSVGTKKNLMLTLINAASPLETKYLVRIFEGRLKIGLALQTVLISLASAFSSIVTSLNDEVVDGEDVKRSKIDSAGGSPADQAADAASDDRKLEASRRLSELATIVKEAYNRQPDLEGLVRLILLFGVESLAHTCRVVTGIPLRPMLAQPAKNFIKALTRAGETEVAAEFKYDGERVQIHFTGKETHVFSRSAEDLSGKYPEISGLGLCERPFIVDGEAVAYSNGEILPFQVLSTRSRKNTGKAQTVEVCVFAFDILYFDGKELLDLPLRERQAILRSNLPEIPGKFHHAATALIATAEDIDTQFNSALAAKCEGVMLKALDAPYRPALRTNAWVKVKGDYFDAFGDSLDLVVVGVYHGKGRRAGVFGGFLLASYNDETDHFEAACKIGTGFSDEALAAFDERFRPVASSAPGEVVARPGIAPDLWLSPTTVWEVKAASLSLSPVYSAAADGGRGISLRFPRFIRERPDKEPRCATTSNQLRRMYNDNMAGSSEDDLFN